MSMRRRLVLREPGAREVVLDVETTGLRADLDDRIVEVAALELIGGKTGAHFHSLVNPERPVPDAAVRVHGLDAAKLAGAPKFAEIAGPLSDFLRTDRLIIHNAAFDVGFLNAEFARLPARRRPLEISLLRAFDTYELAREEGFARRSLDALCRYFSIDASARSLHGALVDCRLLAAVYLKFVESAAPEQGRMDLRSASLAGSSEDLLPRGADGILPPRAHAASPSERAAHRAFLSEHVPGHGWPALEEGPDPPRD